MHIYALENAWIFPQMRQLHLGMLKERPNRTGTVQNGPGLSSWIGPPVPVRGTEPDMDLTGPINKVLTQWKAAQKRNVLLEEHSPGDCWTRISSAGSGCDNFALVSYDSCESIKQKSTIFSR